jgi:N-acetylneuraminic acid mutarotase
MKKTLFYFILIFVILVFFIACSMFESEKSQLSVQPTSIAFTKYANSDVLVISNDGDAELSWEITDKPDWLEVSMSSGKVTTGTDTVVITANINKQVGQYSGTISIESNGGDEEISVSLNIAIWVKKKDMPTARGAHAVGTVNDKIYAIGGDNGQGYETTVEEYNTVTNTWTVKSPMSAKRGDFSGCAVNGKVYVTGGFAWMNNTYSFVEEYNPATDTWRNKSPMPNARWGHSTVAVNGKIYVIGGAFGWPVQKMIRDIDVYDPITDTWTAEGTNIPTSRWMLSCSVVNGKIYAIGGNSRLNMVLPTVEEYDPSTNTWTTKMSMPTARGALSTDTVNGKIYAIGGGNDYPPTIAYGIVEEYDPVTDTWITKTSMPVGRIASSTGVVNGKIYVIGGRVTESAGINNRRADVYEYEAGLE